MNANQELYRNITSVLVIGSIPALLILSKQLITDAINQKHMEFIQYILLAVYLLFLFSGLITLYINVRLVFFNAQLGRYNELALFRNLLKHVGIFFISWALLYVARQRR